LLIFIYLFGIFLKDILGTRLEGKILMFYWKRMLLICVLLIALLLILGFLFLPKPMLEIPKPSGQYSVGFTSFVVTDLGRSRPITLDIWYPAQTTEGLAAVPYTEQALNVQLSKHQGIPLWLNSEVPSYSFLDAPPVNAKHPVIIFNHGFASFSKQNSSNFQELASHSYLVISLARSGESLIAKDANGNTLELDTTLPSYQATLNLQKDTKVLAQTLAAIYTKQRAATTPEAHLAASLELAQTAYFAPMKPLVKSWVKDTEFVIASLKESRGDVLQYADPQRITVMGHSLGGAVALELAKDPPAGVTGIINLDGPDLYFDPSDTRNFQVPVLHFLSTDHKLAGQDIGLYGTMTLPARNNVNGTHIIEIAGTAHNNFTDLNFTPVLKYFTPLLGSVDNATLARQVNEAVLEFLKRTPETLERPLLPETEGVRQMFVKSSQ
jgi:pimeloyl-ACP methyl ester carboxylesterase